MTIQLQKELRALRPAALAAMVLAALPAFIPNAWANDIEFTTTAWMFSLFVAGVLLGSELFGREFSLNTFQVFLTSPTSRSALWQGKVRALTGTLAAVLGLGIILATVRLHNVIPSVATPHLYRFPMAFLGIAIFAACGAASGLFWVLLTRQGSAAFWLALATPPLVCGLTGQLLSWVFGYHATDGAWFGTLALVGLAFWLAAKRLFRQAQDTGTTSLELGGWFAALTHLAPARKTYGATNTTWTGLRALFWKELGLQQFNLVLALGLGTAVVLVLLVLQFSGNDRPDRNNALQSAVMLWHLIWTFVPFLIGTVAFAEERRLKVGDWQSTLPVSIWRQWWVKLGVVFGLGLLLGVILPTLIERVLPRALVGSPSGQRDLLIARLWIWSGGCLLGFYASSLSRNLIQALSGLVALGAGVLAWVLLSRWCVALWLYTGISVARPDLLVVGTAFIVLVPLSLALTRWNFRGPQATPGFVRTNTLALGCAAALILVVPLGLLDRVWERIRIEPRPSSALPQRPGVTPTILADWSFINTVLTPNGGLYGWWNASDLPAPADPASTNKLLHVAASDGVVPLHPQRDWVDASTAQYMAYFLKADGSLWRLTHPMAASYGEQARQDIRKRYGRTARLDEPWWATETNVCWSSGRPVLEHWNVGNDWKAVAAGRNHVVALKRDGTLWGWGENQLGQLGTTNTAPTARPSRIGDRRDWQVIAAGPGITLAADAGGAVWQWGGTENWKLDPEQRAQPTHLASGTHWVSLSRLGWAGYYGVQADGYVWELLSSETVHKRRPELPNTRGRILSERPWRSTTIGDAGLFLVDAEGRLWRSPWETAAFYRFLAGTAGEPDGGIRVGSRSDWIALGSTLDWPSTYLGLTADGVLWRWGAGPEKTEPSILDRLGIPSSLRPRPFAQLSGQQTR